SATSPLQDGRGDPVDADPQHAVSALPVVLEAEVEIAAARELRVDRDDVRADGPPARGRRGSVERDGRRADGGREMHDPGVDADDRAGAGEHRNELREP